MKNTRTTVLAGSVLYFISFITSANCYFHTSLGIPKESDQILCRDGFVIGYNYQHKSVDWVSYYLTNHSIEEENERTNYFKEDEDLPEEYRVFAEDYVGTGYDRGHIAPAADIDFSEDALKESFLLSNIVPQSASFNRGIWKVLETYIREWGYSRKALHVVSGVIWEGGEKYLNDNPERGVKIPNKFYKIVYDSYTEEAIAFILPHQTIHKEDLPLYLVSVDEVEELTGLNFFSKLPDEVEEELEKETPSLWE